ncbi:hypothetical protein [Chryseobacterium carnipullorum]|uniref:hypothetical protein n=1 Tax=Chryseobacterium carnipullorum TaxID=1124835 RepID=UPI001E31437A|nr:hypothetical protein [Chryseobacterium carnipullorum]
MLKERYTVQSKNRKLTKYRIPNFSLLKSSLKKNKINRINPTTAVVTVLPLVVCEKKGFPDYH